MDDYESLRGQVRHHQRELLTEADRERLLRQAYEPGQSRRAKLASVLRRIADLLEPTPSSPKPRREPRPQW